MKAILEYTSLPIDGETPLSQGTGALNPLGALRFMREVAKTKPDDWDITALEPDDEIGGQLVTWSQQLLWGDQLLWSDQLLWGDGVVWENQLLGGTTWSGTTSSESRPNRVPVC